MENSKKMLEFMEGKNKRFIVPVYQRKYSWKEENCKQLYNDLKKLIATKRKSHFFGTLVYSYRDTGSHVEDLIIDGQQRLTTVTLLLLAIYHLLKEDRISSRRPNLAQEIYEIYLTNPFSDEPDNTIKLHPVEEDWNAFKKLFDSDGRNYDKSSILTSNYSFFCDVLKSKEVPVDDLYDAINRLVVICIPLDKDDDAQLIFESLNSTGMALTEGDKIRNYVLMGLPSSREQTTFYNNYWVKIERRTKNDVSSFARDYLTVKQQSTPNIKNVYRDFKEYVEAKSLNTEDLLKDMLKYAGHYNKVLSADSGLNNKELDACLNRLKRLGISVIRPFQMTIFELESNGVLTSDDVFKIFNITENYLFRRNICGVPTNALNKIFASLDKEIQRYEGNTDNYVSKFIYAISSKNGSGEFPDDSEFYEALGIKSIYSMNGSFKNYLFERYQNYKGTGEIDVYDLLESNKYSIEHIMPQTLSDEWKHDLGPGYEDIYTTWINRLANLTLITHNQNLQNESFAEKLVDPDGGYKDSGLWMNKWIADQKSWGLSELKKRNTILCDTALEIWYKPAIDYAPAKPNNDTCTLADEDVELTGRGIYMFSFMNVEHQVSTWADMFMTIVKELHQNDRSVLSALASHTGEDSYLEKYFSFDSDGMHSPVSVDTEIFAETTTSTALKISILRHLFAKYDANPEDLVFYLETKSFGIKDISDILKKWATNKEGIEADIYHSDLRYTRFVTPAVKNDFPDVGDGLSEWKTRNHYFYEIVNETGDELFIKLELNSKNASEEFMKFSAKLHDLYPVEEIEPDWEWCMIFRTQSIFIGNTLSEDDIRAGLDRCMDEVAAFEEDLTQKLTPAT